MAQSCNIRVLVKNPFPFDGRHLVLDEAESSQFVAPSSHLANERVCLGRAAVLALLQLNSALVDREHFKAVFRPLPRRDESSAFNATTRNGQ